MKEIIEAITTKDERDALVNFLDQFDRLVFDARIDARRYISDSAPTKFRQLLESYFYVGGSPNDPESLFQKGKSLRREVPELEKIVLYSPVPLSEQFITSISEWYRTTAGKPVVIEVIQEEELIGGARVELNGYIVEYSIRDYFEKRKKIKEGEHISYGL